MFELLVLTILITQYVYNVVYPVIMPNTIQLILAVLNVCVMSHMCDL